MSTYGDQIWEWALTDPEATDDERALALDYEARRDEAADRAMEARREAVWDGEDW